MPVEFNPYREWLGLECGPLPPNYYQLLGIEPDEPDVRVIHAAADRAMAHVRSHRPGTQGGLGPRLLDEIAAAKSCLTNPEQRLQYDRMRSGRAASVVRPGPSATPTSGSIAEAMAPYDPHAEFRAEIEDTAVGAEPGVGLSALVLASNPTSALPQRTFADGIPSINDAANAGADSSLGKVIPLPLNNERRPSAPE